MNLNKLKYLLLITTLAFAWSCDDEDHTGDSELTPTNPSTSFALRTADGDDVSGTSVTVDEVDTSFVIGVSLSETQIVDVTLNVAVTDGTATEGTDFELASHQIRIPAGSLSGSTEVVIYADDNTSEDDETFTVTVGDDLSSNASVTPTSFSFTVLNTPDFAAYDFATLLAVWDNGEETVAGDSYCAAFDVDILILNETGTAYASTAMATGACPEEADLDFEDGTYLITSNLYSAPDLGQYAVEIPITLTLTRYNNDGSVAAQSSSLTTDEDTTFDSDDDGSSLYLIAVLTVTDGVYELFDPNMTSYGDVKIPVSEIGAPERH